MTERPTSDDRTSDSAAADASDDAGAADRRLDVELEQTFPASDPIPWIHEVGQREPRRARRAREGAP